MTLAAVWKVEERVYAVADTRISRSVGNVLTEHGPKLLPIILLCKQPGLTNLFDRVAFAMTFGFAYAGATLPALATHALASTLFQNLIGPPGTPPPGLDAVSGGIAEIAQRYMREIGELSGLAGLFSAIVFGFCPVATRFRAFKLAPAIDSGPLRVVTSEHDLYGSDTLLVIGSRPELLHERVRAERPSYFAGPDSATPELIAIRETALPKRALESIIREAVDDTIGGTVQSAWLTRAGFEPVAQMEPIFPPLESGRNVTLKVLGFDMFEFNMIGQYRFALSGR